MRKTRKIVREEEGGGNCASQLYFQSQLLAIQFPSLNRTFCVTISQCQQRRVPGIMRKRKQLEGAANPNNGESGIPPGQ